MMLLGWFAQESSYILDPNLGSASFRAGVCGGYHGCLGAHQGLACLLCRGQLSTVTCSEPTAMHLGQFLSQLSPHQTFLIVCTRAPAPLVSLIVLSLLIREQQGEAIGNYAYNEVSIRQPPDLV